MGFIVAAIIVTLVLCGGIAFCIAYMNDEAGEKRYSYKVACLGLLGLLLIIPAFIARIPANSVGILYSPFTGTSETTLPEGFHGKNPFDKVYKISTEIQTVKVESLTTQTKDSQYVTSVLDIKYAVNPSNAYLVFKQFRDLERVSNNLIVPTTQRVLENVTTKYNVMGILGEERTNVYQELEVALKEEFAKYGVDFNAISISDMDAGDEIETAITNEAVAKKAVETAEQELLKVEIDAKQKSVSAQADQDAAKIAAETKKINAEAEAAVKVINAEAEAKMKLLSAEAEKEANELLQSSLSDEILDKQWIEKWDGTVPQFYGAEETGLIFNSGQ